MQPVFVNTKKQGSLGRAGHSYGNLLWLLISLLPSLSIWPVRATSNKINPDSTLQCSHSPVRDKSSHNLHCHLSPLSAEDTKGQDEICSSSTVARDSDLDSLFKASALGQSKTHFSFPFSVIGLRICLGFRFKSEMCLTLY